MQIANVKNAIILILSSYFSYFARQRWSLCCIFIFVTSGSVCSIFYLLITLHPLVRHQTNVLSLFCILSLSRLSLFLLISLSFAYFGRPVPGICWNSTHPAGRGMLPFFSSWPWCLSLSILCSQIYSTCLGHAKPRSPL